jgi:hypothetical protein
MSDIFPVIQPKPPKRTLSLTSLILVPLKQHLGCCVIVPALLKTVGMIGVIGSLVSLSERFHMYLALGLAPFIVWFCLWLEDTFHNWQHRRGHFTHGHTHDHHQECTACEPCPVDHSRPGFWRRYSINLVIAYLLIMAIELFHHHNP